MLVGVGQMILTPDHMGDSHLEIVDHIHEVENRAPIFSPDDQIRLHGPIKGHLTTDHVLHHAWGLGHAKLERSAILIGFARRLQFLQILRIDRSPLTLEVRTLVPGHTPFSIRTFIPIQAQPPHPPKNDIDRLLGIPGLIRVLHPQNKSPPRMTGVEPVKESGSRPANMQKAGR